MIAMLQCFARSSRGNVAVIFAISLVPLLYLTGMGVDYSAAAMREAQLNAIADAASLAAVTPAMMSKTDSASVTAAQNTFNAQAGALSGITYNANNLSIAVVDSITTRTVTVTYTAQSSNFFPSVLGQSAVTLKGTSQAIGTLPPNIDFYLLLDDSPSMAIPASQSGINTMVSLTQNYPSAYNSCAFACHEQHPSTGVAGQDLYQLSRNNNLTLRIDNLRTATQNLTTTAQTIENANNAVYRMAVYTFDSGFHTIGALTRTMSTVSTEAGNISVEEVYDNNWLTSSNNNSDEDTNFDGASGAMSAINALMPAPGNGTNAQGDTPQEILFLVTDGVEDQKVNGTRTYQMTTAECTTIKNRGIRIAVLYTTYYPLPSNNWYQTYIAPFQSTISSTMESCASPGLFYEVATGGDISAALAALFQTAVQTAHLSK